jgi:hypothetical protein
LNYLPSPEIQKKQAPQTASPFRPNLPVPIINLAKLNSVMEKAQSSNQHLSSKRSEAHMGDLVNDIQDLRNDLDKVLDQLK